MQLLRVLSVTALALYGLSLGSAVDARVDTSDTKLLTQPAVSATHVAFIYGGDLFVADVDAAGTVAMFDG